MQVFRTILHPVLAGLIAACGGGGSGNGGTNPPPPPSTLGSIVASPSTLSLGAGQRSTLQMTALNTSSQPMSGVSGYTFSSSAPTVAAVSSAGAVTGLTAGTAMITVSLTLNSVNKTVTVPVTVTGSLPTTATVAAGAESDTFTPDFVAIARGGSVTWTFGARIHNVEFGGTSGAPANVPNSSNTSVSRTFASGGNFAYTCTLHANQNGVVLVP